MRIFVKILKFFKTYCGVYRITKVQIHFKSIEILRFRRSELKAKFLLFEDAR